MGKIQALEDMKVLYDKFIFTSAADDNDVSRLSRYRKLLIDDNSKRRIFMSGSRQLTPTQLLDKSQEAEKDNYKFVVWNLRAEPHLFIVDDKGKEYILNFYNKETIKFTKIIVQVNEDDEVEFMPRGGDGEVEKRENVKITDAFTERCFCESSGIKYMDFPVIDHCGPDNEQTDNIVTYFRENFLKADSTTDESVVIYAHCQGGAGRTSTVMLMADMIFHANIYSFEEIMQRQIDAGGSDIIKFVGNDHGTPLRVARAKFIKRFYNYCRENRGNNFSKSWSCYKEEIDKKNMADEE